MDGRHAKHDQTIENIQTIISQALISKRYYIVQIPRLNQSNQYQKHTILSGYERQLTAAIQLYQKNDNSTNLDIVCKYMLQFIINSQNNENIIEPISRYEIKYGLINDVQLAKNQNIHISACRIIGLKHKQMPVSQFVTIYKANQEIQTSVYKPREGFIKRNNIKLRQRYAIKRFGKKQKHKNSRSSSASLQQIAAEIKKSKALNKPNKPLNVNVQSESAIKRKLQIVESQDSSIQVMDNQIDNILESSKNKIESLAKSKSKPKQSKKGTRKRSRNKQKTKQSKPQKLKQIEEADHSEQLSNKKQTTGPIQNSKINQLSFNDPPNKAQSQMKQKFNIELKQPTVCENLHSIKTLYVNNIDQSSDNKNESNGITDIPSYQASQANLRKQQKTIFSQQKSQSLSSQNVLNKIKKITNKKVQNNTKQLQQQDQQKIVPQLLAPGSVSQQININTDTNIMRSKSNPSSSNPKTETQANKQKSKKSKKQMVPANNTTLDQFFIKKR